jgi:hypothetical protein
MVGLECIFFESMASCVSTNPLSDSEYEQHGQISVRPMIVA